MRKRSLLFVILGLVLAAGAFVACGEEAPAGSGTEPAGGSSGGAPVASGSGGSSGGSSGGTAVEEPPPPPADEARPSWADDTYELTATATGPYAVGTPSTFEVRLTPRGEYHVNRNYPWSVTVTPPAAVVVPTATFDAATAAEMTDTVARFVVPFTPTAAGSHEVTAAVDFGICREEACIFQMHSLLVSLVATDGVAADGVVPSVGAPPAVAPGEPAPGGGPGAPEMGATSSARPIPAAAEAGSRS